MGVLAGMATYRIALIPVDGIGPEVVPAGDQVASRTERRKHSPGGPETTCVTR